MTLAELRDVVDDMREFVSRCGQGADEVQVYVFGEGGIPRKIQMEWVDNSGPVTVSRKIG